MIPTSAPKRAVASSGAATTRSASFASTIRRAAAARSPPGAGLAVNPSPNSFASAARAGSGRVPQATTVGRSAFRDASAPAVIRPIAVNSSG